MDAANELLVDALGRVAESVPQVLDGLSADQLAHRPSSEANSIAWLVWHLSRVLDAQLADLTGEEQVWTAGGYADRFGLDLPVADTGYGHSSAQVAKVEAPADLLAGYAAAVHERYLPWLREVDDWDRVVDERWDPPVTLAVRLVSIVDDCARHVGQAEYVRGLLTGPPFD